MSRYFIPDSWYFITVPTDKHRPIFRDLFLRAILKDQLERMFARFHVQYLDYAVMEDHYHFLGSFGRSEEIPKLLQSVNGAVSHSIRKKLNVPLPIWGEYHVFVPMKEELLDRVRGYVIGNSLKHDDVSDFDGLYEWPYSTYRRVVDQEGIVYAKDIVSSVIDFDEKEFFQTLPKSVGQDRMGLKQSSAQLMSL